MLVKLVATIVCVLSGLWCCAQDTELKYNMDSLKHVTQAMSDSPQKASNYYKISYDSQEMDTILRYSRLGMDVAKGCGDTANLLNNYTNFFYALYYLGLSDKALAITDSILLIAKDYNDLTRLASIYNNYTNIYTDYDSVDLYYHKALDIYQKLGKTSEITYIYRNLANLCTSRSLYLTAYEYLFKALMLDKELNDTLAIGHDNFYLSYVLTTQFQECEDSAVVRYKFAQAKEYNLFSLKFIPEYDCMYIYANQTASLIYSTLATFCGRRDYYDSSRVYIKTAIDAAQKYGFKSVELQCRMVAANLDASVGMAAVAVEQLKKLYAEAIKLGEQTTIENSVQYLAKSYAQVGDYKNGYAYLKRFYEKKIKDVDENALRKTISLQQELKHNEEMLRLEAQTQRKELLLKEENRRTRLMITFSVVFMIMLVAIVLTLFVIGRNRKRDTERLKKQKDEIEHQKEFIESFNNQIIKSINYAKRIQSSVLTSENEINAIFDDSFVIYMPKDIVSGDWYYVGKVGEYKIVALADCTGHGVPGALLSMLGISAFKDILNMMVGSGEDILPASILDKLRIFIKDTVTTTTGQEVGLMTDGMDVSIGLFDLKNKNMIFASAMQSASIVSGDKFLRIKGDSMPVGSFIREKEHFTNYIIPINSGDAVYFFSDGLKDTINNKRQKYSLARFSSFVLQNNNLSMQKIGSCLQQSLIEWKQDTPQIDDITVVGVRIN